MRIFTCTPVAFGGGPDFFSRDSGLLCRGFQALGIDSRAVMPGERLAGDEQDLIRTSYQNLESAEWWKSLEIDGLVLYSWGRPKFRKVAAAIRKAGIFLVLNQDNGGLISPLVSWREWLSEQWMLAGQGRSPSSWLRLLKLVLRGTSIGLVLTDPLRASHLAHGNLIACVSPMAADHYRKICRIYGGEKLATRVAVIPHAVENRFVYSGGKKLHQIVCVGRWDDETQKRPWLLMRVIPMLLDADASASVVIVGTMTAGMREWHASLDETRRTRVTLCGRVDRAELVRILQDSLVFYSPSAFESFGIAAAEALCCGCSVVARQSPSMAAFEWFVSENSGRLATGDTPEEHARMLTDELAAWNMNGRNPDAISGAWSGRLHADKVASRLVEVFGCRAEAR